MSEKHRPGFLRALHETGFLIPMVLIGLIAAVLIVFFLGMAVTFL